MYTITACLVNEDGTRYTEMATNNWGDALKWADWYRANGYEDVEIF